MKLSTKKAISLILTLSMVLGTASPAFAAESEAPVSSDFLEVEAGYDTAEAFSQGMEDALFENANTLTSEALLVVDQYARVDDNGSYYITDEAALQSELTTEQYEAVCMQILGVNTKVADATPRAELGTEKSPYVLKDGVKRSLNFKDGWFSCQIWGATDFLVSSGSTAAIVVYKKTLFGKNDLYTGSQAFLSTTISKASINNGANTYLVHVVPTSMALVACTITTHVDAYTNSKGATWKYKSDSAIYDTNILYMQKYYGNKEQIANLAQMINDSTLDNYSALCNGTLGVSLFLVGLGIPQTATALGVVGVITSFKGPFDFRSNSIKQLYSVTGYNTETKKAKNGASITEYMAQGLTFYTIEAWDGTSKMTGPKGWTGTWTANK